MSTKARAVGLNDQHRRDIELLLIGMAFASSKEVRRDLATELCAGGDSTTGGLLSEDTASLMQAIGTGKADTVVEWLKNRGVNLTRGLTVQDALVERLESVAKLSRVRRLCQRLTHYEAMSTEEIAVIAELIVRARGSVPALPFPSTAPAPAPADPEPQQELS